MGEWHHIKAHSSYGLTVMAESASERCPLCLLERVRPVYSPDCLHGMCGTCGARHVWQSRQSGTVHCPLCRARVRRLTRLDHAQGAQGAQPPSASKSDDFSVDFAGVRWTLSPVAGESVLECMSHVFDVPRDRLKVLAKGGRVVSDYAEMLSAPETHFRLMGTPRSDADASAALAYEASWRRTAVDRAWVTLGMLAALWRLVWLFFASLMPWKDVRAEHAEQEQALARERHRHQQQ